MNSFVKDKNKSIPVNDELLSEHIIPQSFSEFQKTPFTSITNSTLYSSEFNRAVIQFDL